MEPHLASAINAPMRAIVVDWLVQVHDEYKLAPETLFLAVAVLDRFLANAPSHVARARLQLVGVTALLIASKMDGIEADDREFTPADCAYITARAYRAREVVAMERVMLNALRFKLLLPTAYVFFTRLAFPDERVRELALFLLELALQDYGITLLLLDSTRAEGALLAATCALATTACLGAVVRCPRRDVRDAAALLARLHAVALERRKKDAVVEKYGELALVAPNATLVEAGERLAASVAKIAAEGGHQSLRMVSQDCHE